MKKLICLLITCAAFNAHAQRCGTMEHAAQRQLNDPSYNSRMEATETMIREWIKQNAPVSSRTFPAIEGFIATGNIENDSKNYAAAKQRLYAVKHVTKKQ